MPVGPCKAIDCLVGTLPEEKDYLPSDGDNSHDCACDDDRQWSDVFP